MFSDENKKDSAFYVFEKLVNFKKAPYKYKIHANIELAKKLFRRFIVNDIVRKNAKVDKKQGK